MVNKAGNKGREGENGIVKHLNKWFDNPDIFGPRRVRSKGSNDDGDITGVPLTMIECKNYKKPVLTSLMNNARIKAVNSKRPVWFLTIKKSRRSSDRSGSWYAGCDLKSLISSLRIDLSEEELDLLRDRKRPYQVVKDIGNWSDKYGKNFNPPEYQWKVCLLNDGRTGNALSAVDEALDWWFNDEGFEDTIESEELEHNRVLPIVIVRAAGADYDDLEKWYAMTSVHFMARILESMSLLPQDEREYDEESSIYWDSYILDRWASSDPVLDDLEEEE